MNNEETICAQLNGCEDRLFRAKGYLNVLSKAIALDEVRGTSDDSSHGYSEILSAVQAMLLQTLEEVEVMQRTLYHCDSSDDSIAAEG